MPENPVFLCPICNSHNYEEIIEPIKVIGPGSRAKGRLIYYSCRGCSVLFLDPKKLSKASKRTF